MPKAFKRISASELENCLDNNELPDSLVEVLREAIKNARENVEMDGEAPIQVFITDEGEEEDED